MLIRFAIVFQKDGLDEAGIRDELNSIATVTEEQDDKIQLSDGWHDVKIYYLEGGFGAFVKVKLKYHCVKALDSEYVLFPIE